MYDPLWGQGMSPLKGGIELIHNLVDNRQSKREEKALDEKARRKQEKTRALVEEKMDREGKSRSSYRRSNRRDWLEMVDDDDLTGLD